jgi:hypothetical protein
VGDMRPAGHLIFWHFIISWTEEAEWHRGQQPTHRGQQPTQHHADAGRRSSTRALVRTDASLVPRGIALIILVDSQDCAVKVQRAGRFSVGGATGRGGVRLRGGGTGRGGVRLRGGATRLRDLRPEGRILLRGLAVV